MRAIYLGNITVGGTADKSYHFIIEDDSVAKVYLNQSNPNWFHRFRQNSVNNNIGKYNLTYTITGYGDTTRYTPDIKTSLTNSGLFSTGLAENQWVKNIGQAPNSWINLAAANGTVTGYPSVAYKFNRNPQVSNLTYDTEAYTGEVGAWGVRGYISGSNYNRVFNYRGNISRYGAMVTYQEGGGSSYITVNLFGTLNYKGDYTAVYYNDHTGLYSKVYVELVHAYSDDGVHEINIFGDVTINSGYLNEGATRAYTIVNVMDGGSLNIIGGNVFRDRTRAILNVYGSGKLKGGGYPTIGTW